MKRYVYLVLDDHDRHGVGCTCGLCDSNGKSYGVAIYDMTPFGITHEEEVAEWVQDALKQQDPLDRVYASGEQYAYEAARRVCQAEGWTPVSAATPSQIAENLLGSLRMLVGPDGYLTQHDICECDNTHEQNHTVCRICWARYYYETYAG